MKIRFVDIGIDSVFTLDNIKEQVRGLDIHAEFLYRRDGYFYNKRAIEELIRIYKHLDGVEELIIYTDDETMLDYSEYDESIHNFKVEMIFRGSKDFIPLKELHPNLRESNSLLKMYHIGIFWDDYWTKLRRSLL